VIDRVDADRLRDLTLELVACESPTGDTADVARLYASRLEGIGMDVELLDERFPRTPIVVGRLRGGEPGPTIVLNGHLDTVPIPHEPPRVEDGTIYGRGSADMKGALACAAEAARLVGERGSFPGELVIVAIGLHEAPDGRGEDLAYLLGERGFTADLGVVGELGGPTLPVAHVGCATFEITIRRQGIVTHELQTAAGTPNPNLVAARVIEAIRVRNDELAEVEHEWVGPESYFLGEVHGGDFYNRHPVECRLVGTRRWAPGNTLEQADAEFRALLEPIGARSACAIDLDLRISRGAYRIDAEDRLVVALREAYRDVTGEELPLTGVRLVADGAMFHAAGIPTVYHGPMGSGAHGDVESIEVAELVRATRVYLALLKRLCA
jgi:acetylornithine deacetylase/succinyl-diaminopimelate desuccinylase-like protein